MPDNTFCLFELRARDVIAAQTFYSTAFGAEFWGPDILIAPLPQPAAAVGVPPHWLGHVRVPSVPETTRRIVDAGGQPLGPSSKNAAGQIRSVLRDPLGAVFAVTDEPCPPTRPVVGWHVHHSHDEGKAMDLYSQLFGWIARPPTSPNLPDVRTRAFAYSSNVQTVGMVTNAASLPDVHPQWLFCFIVKDAEAVAVTVRDCGGTHLPPQAMPGGGVVVGCEDPQGAAFALLQGRPGNATTPVR